MARNEKPGTARVDLDISIEAQMRFIALHEALGFRTKSQTFEAVVYHVSTKDKLDPAALERIERKLDRFFERIDDLV